MMPKQTKSAGWVVVNTFGQILVVNQKGRSWSLPKGHIEKEESDIGAARREIEEESGITQLEFVKGLGTYQRYRLSVDGGDDPSEVKTIIMFLFKTQQLALKPKDVENPEAKWVDRKSVADILTHKKDKGFFLSILSKI